MSTELVNQEDRALVPKGSFAEVVVKAASACTKLVSENCGLCTVYCDKQVQYESVLEPYTIGKTLEGLFSRLDNSSEVQVYRNHLFDEQSVVEQASSRQDGE